MRFRNFMHHGVIAAWNLDFSCAEAVLTHGFRQFHASRRFGCMERWKDMQHAVLAARFSNVPCSKKLAAHVFFSFRAAEAVRRTMFKKYMRQTSNASGTRRMGDEKGEKCRFLEELKSKSTG